MQGYKEKSSRYNELVNQRKNCRACPQLTNLSVLDGGIFDSEHLGSWSVWQGNLDSSLMVVGQDWGDISCCRENSGHEPPKNPTNETLRRLLASIGIVIDPPSPSDRGGGKLFFTNAILCLKTGGLQAKVRQSWFSNCGFLFLKPTVEIVQPKVLVTLSKASYRAIAVEYELPVLPFKDAVETEGGFAIGEQVRLHPAYHCGRRILNTYRPMDKQLEDWARIGRTLGPKPGHEI